MEAVVGGLEVDDHGKYYFYSVDGTRNNDNKMYITIPQWSIVWRENLISILVRHSASQHLILSLH